MLLPLAELLVHYSAAVRTVVITLSRKARVIDERWDLANSVSFQSSPVTICLQFRVPHRHSNRRDEETSHVA